MMNQIDMKTTDSPKVRLTPFDKIDFIVLPSVLNSKVESGLYSVISHVELWYSSKELSDLKIHRPA